jgi:RNA polymerase sigma factor (sigma-70 family)
MAGSDAALLEKWIVARDADAFAEIVSRYSAMVYSTCKRVIGNPNDAEDVAQECFIELVRVRKTIRPSLGGWLHTVATRRSLDRIKAETRRKRREVRFAQRVDMSGETTWDDMKTHIDEAIAALPEKLREPITYRFLEGQTQNAIARNLGISDSTVQYRLSKGIEEMRKFLKKRGVVAPSVVLASLLGTHLTAQAAPAALTAALGKLTLAGATGAMGGTAATSATGIATLGGVLVMKKIIIAAAVVLAGGIGMWAVKQKRPPEPVQPVQEIHAPEPAESEAEEAAQRDLVVSQRIAEEPRDAETLKAPGEPVISGVVVDIQNSPVAEARVIVKGTKTPVKETTVCDAQGYFEFVGPEPVIQVELSAEKGDAVSEPIGPIYLTEKGLHDVVITLYSSGSIAGTVIDGAGSPLDDAEVVADSVRRGALGAGNSGETDQDGQFIVEGLYPDTYDISVRIPASDTFKMAVVEPVAVAAGEDVTDLLIQVDIWKDLSISGCVMDDAGRPVARASVLATEPTWSQAGTDEKGVYMLANISEGLYSIQVHADGSVSASATGVPAGSEGVDFVLERRGAIHGRVVRSDTGEPIPAFEVGYRKGAWNDPGTLLSRTYNPAVDLRMEPIQNAEGDFYIDDVDPGLTTVLVRSSEFAPATEVVSVTPGGTGAAEVLVQLHPGCRLRGVVHDAADAPISGALVFVGYLPADAENVREANAAARSGADGTFVLKGLAPESRRLFAFHPDYAVGYADILPEPDREQTVEIVLTQGGTVQGFVWYGGEPAANQVVRVIRDILGTTSSMAARTSVDGAYKIEHVPDGEVEVRARVAVGDSLRSTERRVRQHALVRDGQVTAVDFDIGLGYAVVEGTVTVEGIPPSNAVVKVYPDSEADMPEFLVAHADRSSGRFSVHGIPAGAIRLEVTVWQELPTEDVIDFVHEEEFRIADGEVVRRDIDLTY